MKKGEFSSYRASTEHNRPPELSTPAWAEASLGKIFQGVETICIPSLILLSAITHPAVWVRAGGMPLLMLGGVGGWEACGVLSGYPAPSVALQAVVAHHGVWRTAVGAGGALAWVAGVHRPVWECRLWSSIVVCAGASGGWAELGILGAAA